LRLRRAALTEVCLSEQGRSLALARPQPRAAEFSTYMSAALSMQFTPLAAAARSRRGFNPRLVQKPFALILFTPRLAHV